MHIIFSKNSLNQGLITIWRFWVLVTISIILTFSTTISSLITGIERLSKPLKGLYDENIESQKVLKLKLYDYLSLVIVIFLVIVIY